MRGIVSTCSRDYGRLPASFFHRDFDYANLLRVAQRRTFAGRTARHEKIDSGLNLPPYQSPERVFIQRKIAPKWRY
jgi:hypothetical protein